MSWLPWSERRKSPRLLSDYMDGESSAWDREEVEEDIAVEARVALERMLSLA